MSDRRRDTTGRHRASSPVQQWAGGIAICFAPETGPTVWLEDLSTVVSRYGHLSTKRSFNGPARQKAKRRDTGGTGGVCESGKVAPTAPCWRHAGARHGAVDQARGYLPGVRRNATAARRAGVEQRDAM